MSNTSWNWMKCVNQNECNCQWNWVVMNYHTSSKKLHNRHAIYVIINTGTTSVYLIECFKLLLQNDTLLSMFCEDVKKNRLIITKSWPLVFKLVSRPFNLPNDKTRISSLVACRLVVTSDLNHFNFHKIQFKHLLIFSTEIIYQFNLHNPSNHSTWFKFHQLDDKSVQVSIFIWGCRFSHNE